jgi:hypothetical protein
VVCQLRRKSHDLRSGSAAVKTPAQVARLVAVSEAEALTPMADLAARWGITANTVSRRLSLLGIKPIRQGNFRFVTTEQLAQGDELQQHVLSGKPMEAFPRADQPEGGLVARRVAAPAQVAGQVDQITALVAALSQVQQPAAVDPLQRARALADAADNALVLDNAELKALGVRGVAGASTDQEAHGYRFRRHQPKGEGTAVLWTVERVIGQRPAGGGTSPATSRSVGFLADPPVAARQTINVSAVALPAF